MITAGLIFCLLYSIDILILKKGGKPSISDCKKGKGHAMYDECPSYDVVSDSVHKAGPLC